MTIPLCLALASCAQPIPDMFSNVQALLLQAQEVDDGMNYVEPPRLYQPVRHCLAALQLRLAQPTKAEQVGSRHACLQPKRWLVVWAMWLAAQQLALCPWERALRDMPAGYFTMYGCCASATLTVIALRWAAWLSSIQCTLQAVRMQISLKQLPCSGCRPAWRTWHSTPTTSGPQRPGCKQGVPGLAS